MNVSRYRDSIPPASFLWIPGSTLLKLLDRNLRTVRALRDDSIGDG